VEAQRHPEHCIFHRALYGAAQSYGLVKSQFFLFPGYFEKPKIELPGCVKGNEQRDPGNIPCPMYVCDDIGEHFAQHFHNSNRCTCDEIVNELHYPAFPCRIMQVENDADRGVYKILKIEARLCRIGK
jgi:hypothetical protein